MSAEKKLKDWESPSPSPPNPSQTMCGRSERATCYSYPGMDLTRMEKSRCPAKSEGN